MAQTHAALASRTYSQMWSIPDDAHAATPQPWNGFVLFPLYHPSPQVVVSPTGRTYAAQEADYHALARLLGALAR